MAATLMLEGLSGTSGAKLVRLIMVDSTD